MFEAYKIGIRISLINHVSAGLASMSRDFAKTHAEVTALEKKIKSIQNTAMKGGLMFGAGLGIAALLKGPYEEAKKLAQAQANFQTLNLSASENAQAFGKAATMSHQILGTTITGNIKLIHDLHTAFGDLPHAIGSANTFAKMSIVAKVANGGKDVDGLVNAAAKALEHRGGKVINNPVEFAAESDMMTKVMLGSKMRVSPNDYLTASGTGKMAYQMYDKEYLYGNYAGLISINGGARTGTEGMGAFSSLIGGHMDQKGKGFLADLGLWQEGFSKKRLGIMHQAMVGLSPEERKIAITSMGGQAAVSGGLRDADAELFAHRPDLFMANVMVPAIKKRFGISLNDEQIALLIAKNFNRSTGNNLGTLVTMAVKLAKDSAIFNKSMGNETAYQHYMRSPEGAEEAASAAWKNFLAMFGSVYLPKITSGLLKLAGVLDSLASSVKDHPKLWGAVADALGLIALGLGLTGGGMLLSAAFSGLGLALAFSSVGGAAGIAKTGTALFAAAGGLGMLAKASVLFMAAYAGWKAGGWLNDAINDKVKKNTGYDSLAEWGYDAFHQGTFDPRQNADDRFVKPAPRAASGKQGDIYLDGEKVGKHVARHVTTGISRPLAGVSGVDTGMFMLHPSMNTGR